MEKGTNNVEIVGLLGEAFVYRNESKGEKFYQSTILTKRLSGTIDCIPISVSERLVDVEKDWTGKMVAVTGQIRSYRTDGIPRTVHLLFIQDFRLVEEESQFMNFIELDGHICTPPAYRETYSGRDVTSFLLAVNRNEYNRCDYIPCILWNRNAKYAANFDVGTHIAISGRIQSRCYEKEGAQRTTYEVSVSQVEVISDCEEKNESRSEENQI